MARGSPMRSPKLSGIFRRVAAEDLSVVDVPCGDAGRVVLMGDLPLLAGCSAIGDIPSPFPLSALDARVREITTLTSMLA